MIKKHTQDPKNLYSLHLDTPYSLAPVPSQRLRLLGGDRPNQALVLCLGLLLRVSEFDCAARVQWLVRIRSP